MTQDVTTARFWVEVEGMLSAAFRECSGLSAEMDVMTYSEGGLNDYEHKLPGRIKYTNVTLRKGVASSADLCNWLYQFATGGFERKNISIIMYHTDGQEAMRWNLIQAYPVKWQGPDLKADDNNIPIETLEVAHNGLVIG